MLNGRAESLPGSDRVFRHEHGLPGERSAFRPVGGAAFSRHLLPIGRAFDQASTEASRVVRRALRLCAVVTHSVEPRSVAVAVRVAAFEM